MEFSKNNLDLIRLFAATQVAINHLFFHFGLEEETSNFLLINIIKITQFFPGVPIFFMISGYLISKSYEKNPDLKNYFRNRFLRLYPAAWFCLLLSIIFVVATGNLSSIMIMSKGFIAWLITEIVFIHIYSYDGFSDFGTGKLNGSLWTLPVEIQFYIFIPIIYYTFEKLGLTQKKNFNFSIIIILIFSFTYHEILVKDNILSINDNMVMKIAITLLPNYFYMFAIGVLLQKNIEIIKPIIRNTGLYWLTIYTSTCIILNYFNFSIAYGNDINLIVFVFLSLTILSLAYTKVDLSKKLIGHNDISYGVYIYHMPLANLILELDTNINLITYFLTLILVYLLALFSWRFIEKPCIRMKKKSINDLT
tara:strand:+ start:104 stop:1198 length:1095 start_codon:yes stop_codon:yes gene_type:complete